MIELARRIRCAWWTWQHQRTVRRAYYAQMVSLARRDFRPTVGDA